jgi:hypothetical protein
VIVFALACMGAAVYLGIMLLRNEAKTEHRLRQARADITDMTILFQTMRDIIGQQKALAKDFNEELEHKMGQVKHILNLGMEKNKQLYDKQQRIVADLEEAQAQIDGLFRQLTHASKASQVIAPPAPRVEAPVPKATFKSAPPAQAAPAPVDSAPRPTPAPRTSSSVLVRSSIPDMRDTPAGLSTPHQERAMPPRNPAAPASSTPLTPAEEARLADTGVTKAPFTSWIAEDLMGSNGSRAEHVQPSTSIPTALTARNPAPLDEEEPEPQAPGNGEAAREAFRALLNMPMNDDVHIPPLEMPGQTKAMAAAVQGHVTEEEVHLSAPLQQRVLEYSEAGMTVAEVSRELGIGKGEVRLMLSLARQAQPGNS